MIPLAVAAAALAGLLAVRPRARLPGAAPARPAPVLLLALAVPVAALVTTVVPARDLVQVSVLSALAAGVVAGVARLLGRRARSRSAAADAARVLETCELLAGELAAGQPAGRALDRAAEAWPALRVVAETHALGGDVPAAWREVAARPGASDLRLLAAAWVVSHRTGGGLADAVRRTARSVRAQRATARLVEGELASARATARLVALLPALALLMGSGSGGQPLNFLLGTPVGLGCLGLGLAFGLAGLWWIESIADQAPGP